MAARNAFILIGLAIASCMGTLDCNQSREQAVPYTRMNPEDYQNFLINWDNLKNPVLFALVQDSIQYNTLFHPAALNGMIRPFSPKAEFFNDAQILLVARVMLASEDIHKAFEVERVTEKNKELTFHYRYHEPGVEETFAVKYFMVLRLPRKAYTKAVFFENEKPIGELNIAGGQWYVPEMPAEPDPLDAGSAQ
jgi:hypothetical protein